MFATSMRRIVPEALITPLKALGKHDWLRWTPVDTDPPSNRLSLLLPRIPEILEQPDFALLLAELVSEQHGGLFPIYVLSKALAEGPKLLCPTTEQCLALEHVDVNLSFDDYVQPFPTFLVELPQEYRRILTERFRHEAPAVAVTHHDERSKYILSCCCDGPSLPRTFHIMSPRWSRIEEVLRFSDQPGDDLDQSEVIQRVAINFGLLMTHFGVRNLGPADPHSHARHVRNARRRNRGKAERARRLLEAEIHLIGFDQEVVVFDRQASPRTEPESDGSPKRTHWRRGHFRHQFYGPNRASRKLIFVRPILINAHLLHGDPSNTDVRLRLDAQPSSSAFGQSPTR